MNEIGTYGTYTVKKIAEFLGDKIAFDDPTLKNLLQKMITTENIDPEFKLHYIPTDNQQLFWHPHTIKGSDLEYEWGNPQLTGEESEYIGRFSNILEPMYETPHILSKVDKDFKLSKESLDSIVQKLVNNPTKISGMDLYYPSFSPDPKHKQSNYWYSLNMGEAVGYIQNKIFYNRTQIGTNVSGALFIHRMKIKRELTLLNADMPYIKYILLKFGISENMLTHNMDIVGNFVCKEINTLLKKYNNIQFDGLLFKSNAESVILCKHGGYEYAGSVTFKSSKKTYLPNLDKLSVGKQTEICSKFYNPPKIYVNSHASLYRHTLTQIMKKNIEVNNVVVGETGIDPEKVNSDLVSIVLASITNALRPYVYQAIAEINESMAKFGKFIIAGGDAINMLIDPSDRAVSPDIDTKFILFFDKFFNKFSENSTVPNQQIEMESEYFLMTLLSKQELWYTALNKVLNKWNSRDVYSQFYWSLLRPLEMTVPFTILGITFVPPHKIGSYKPFRKRLTVMPKSSEKDPPFLFDVDLFAIDIYINSAYLIKWSETPSGKTMWESEFEYIDMNDQVNITGLLDMPYTKPTHLGYNLGSPEYHTQVIINPFAGIRNHVEFFGAKTSLNTIENIKGLVDGGHLPPIGKMTIPIANVDYVKHDVSLLHRLQLRKGTKLKKDQDRLKLLEKYASGQAVQLDTEEYAETIKQVDTKNIRFTSSDIAGLRISHIIKFLAIPSAFPGEVDNPRGFINCPAAIPFEVRFDTFNRFNYTTNTWQQCCDIIPNQFEFRYSSKALSEWSKNPTQKENLICILTEWNNYLIHVRKLTLQEQLVRIGVMLYGFRLDFLRNPKYTNNPRHTINLFVSCILIYAVGLHDIGGEIGILTNTVYNNIKKLRKQ